MSNWRSENAAHGVITDWFQFRYKSKHFTLFTAN